MQECLGCIFSWYQLVEIIISEGVNPGSINGDKDIITLIFKQVCKPQVYRKAFNKNMTSKMEEIKETCVYMLDDCADLGIMS